MVPIMDILPLNPLDYTLAIDLYTRLLGVIYLCVYIPFLFQVRGLWGKEGVLPIGLFLKRVRQQLGWKGYFKVPSLFWLGSHDYILLGTCWVAIGLAVLLIFGIFTPLVLFLLFLIHLSFASSGQDFMQFGWETLLIEMTSITVLLTATTAPNYVAWIALNFLLFRFMIQAGTSKFKSRDPCWRDMTGLSYHYVTQPIPNRWAWYADKLPMWFQKLSTLAMFWVEIIVPFLIFNIPEVRLFVFANFIALLLIIWLTGNFSYLNHMIAVFSVILVSNQFLEPLMGAPANLAASPVAWDIFISAVSGGILFLEVIDLWNYYLPVPLFTRILRFWYPYHICHPHQLFSMMTKKRFEVVIEGSDDGKEWKEYLFWYKPSEVTRRPRRISPYQPRIDWQAWFLPFRPFKQQIWFHQLLSKMLMGSPRVLKLFRYNPFPDKPPLYVRALYYEYVFTSWEERKKTKAWWKRKLLGNYSSVIQLKR